jgi:hypothetical protein
MPPETTPPLTRMSSLVARIVPLSTIAPAMVLSLRTLNAVRGAGNEVGVDEPPR